MLPSFQALVHGQARVGLRRFQVLIHQPRTVIFSPVTREGRRLVQDAKPSTIFLVATSSADKTGGSDVFSERSGADVFARRGDFRSGVFSSTCASAADLRFGDRFGAPSSYLPCARDLARSCSCSSPFLRFLASATPWFFFRILFCFFVS